MNHDTWSVFCWFLKWDRKSLTSQREKKILIVIFFCLKNIPFGSQVPSRQKQTTLWFKDSFRKCFNAYPVGKVQKETKPDNYASNFHSASSGARSSNTSVSLLFPGIFILCFQHWTAPKLWPLCTQLLAANKWTRPTASLKMIFSPRRKWPVGVLPLYICIGDNGKAEKRLMRGGSQDKWPCGSSCIHLRLKSAWNVLHSLYSCAEAILD